MNKNLLTAQDYLSGNTDLIALLHTLSNLPEDAVRNRLSAPVKRDDGAYTVELGVNPQPNKFGDAVFSDIVVTARPVDNLQWSIWIDANALCGKAAAKVPMGAAWSPINKDVLVFRTAETRKDPLPALDSLGPIGAYNEVNLALGVVSQVPGLSKLAASPPVDGLELALHGPALVSSRAYFILGQDWTIVPDVFVIEKLSAGAGYLWTENQHPSQLALALTGEAMIGRHTYLIASVQLPDLAVRAALDTEKEEPSLRDFFKDFGLDEDFWPDLRIHILRMALEPAHNHRMLFDFEVDGNWRIFGNLSLERLFFHFEQTGSGGDIARELRFECALRFFAGQASEFTLNLLAAYRTLLPGQTQLLLEGTVAPGKPIRLGQMVEDLTGLTLPGPLHSLAIYDLHMSLEIFRETVTDDDGHPVRLSERRVSIGFTVGSSEGNWVIVPGLLELAPASVDLVIGGKTDIRIRETLVVFGADWAIDVQLPSLIGSVQLQGELAIAGLFEHFHLDDHGFAGLTLTDATMQFDGGARSVSIHLELQHLWRYHGFELEDVQLGVSYHGQEGGGVEAGFTGVAKIDRGTDKGTIEILVQAVHPGAGLGWQMEGSVAIDPTTPLTVRDLGRHFHFDQYLAGLGPMADLGLVHLGLRYDTATKAMAADCTIDVAGKAQIQLAVERRPVRNAPGDAAAKPDKIPFDTRFSGVLKAGPAEFDLIFERKGSGQHLVGVYIDRGGGELSLASLVEAVGGSAPEVLEGLKLPIKSAMLARSKPVNKTDAPSAMLLAADMDVGIDLSGLGHLPLVGAAFRDENRITLGFTAIYATAAFNEADLKEIHAITPPGSPLLPKEVPQSLTLCTTMMLGHQSIHIDLKGLSGPKKKGDLSPKLGSPVPRRGPKGNQPPAVCPIPSSASLHWLDVRKQLGKVLNLRRVGVGMAGKDIHIGFDGAITVGPLTLDLMGLGASYNLDSHELGFALQGLGFEVKTSSLEIGASFANLGDDFVGRATLKMGEFGLTALGAFAMLDGHPSMFIYGVLNAPLGGPAFFFVEGLAAGFGFNRHLILPSIDNVHKFPFVAEAIGMVGSTREAPGSFDQSGAVSLGEELKQLHEFVHPQVGAIFIAAGLKFNSFRLVDVFALVTVILDLERKRAQVGLLGVATVQVPSDSPEVIAFVELNVLATIDVNDAIVLFQAQLTPLSWILSPDCHLQGGFAAALWGTGPHAGDFVYCLGGYHPHFPVPRHYPAVPRLGFHWNIGSEICIRGELYYALTPVAVMAGGCLNATWQSGGLRAWFTLQADFLIQWKPPQYEALINVEIGASYDTIFGTITISIGAGVSLWGPCADGQQVGGTAHFSYGPVHFSIDFGGPHAGPPALDWDQFQTAFLPKAGKPVCVANVTAGLVRTLDLAEPKETWSIVDPRLFHVAVSTAIPFSTVNQVKTEWQDFSVAPMGKTEVLVSDIAVTIVHGHGPDSDTVDDEFDFLPVDKAFPGAMWGKGTQNPASPRTVRAGGAVLIKPKNVPKPGQTAEIPRSCLGFNAEGHTRSLAERTHIPAPPAEMPRTDRAAALAKAAQSISEPPPTQDKLLGSLGFDVARRVTITDRYLHLLRATPRVAAR